MKRNHVVPLLAFCLCLVLSVPISGGDDYQPLFNGDNLDGWHNPFDWGEATVKDGVIHLKSSKKFFLVSDNEYGDFVLKVDVKVPDRASNSGIQFRSHKKKNRVWGYQAEVDPSDRRWAGGLYDEGRRGWIHPLKGQKNARQAFKPTEWNTYRIKCVGDHIQIWVNGTKTTDLHDPTDLAGHIALQHHGEDGKVYKFRNIRIKDLGRHEWGSMFNGKNLDGWHTTPGGKWAVHNGMIVGTNPDKDLRHGLLVSDDVYGDFTARFSFKVLQGNSGIYFRSEEVDKRVSALGIQAEVANSENVGGLYETGGRGWMVTPSSDQVKNVYKEGKWNDMTISAHGPRITTFLNGRKMIETVDEKGREKGHFALQLHGGQLMHVKFRSVHLLRKANE